MERPSPAHPFDAEQRGRRIRSRASLVAAPAPPGGVIDPPFRWDDLLEGPPPGDEERGPPILCVPGHETLADTVRIENPLLLRVIEGRVEIEDRLAVTERKLTAMLEAETALVGQRLKAVARDAEQRAVEAEGPVGTRVHRGLARSVRGLRRLTRGIAALPDKIVVHGGRAATFLSTPEGRQRFRKGLLDPRGIPGEQKAVTLFVLIAAILGTLMVVHFAVTLALPDLARPWRAMLLMFLYVFGAAFGFPLPIEPVIVGGALVMGAFAAIAVALVAKVLAAWLVFFIGEEAHEKMRERAAGSPRFARFLDLSERFARRFGLFAVALFIATPGLPDFIALYVFSALDMKLSRFLAGVALGGLVLYSALTLGFLRLFHLG